MVVSTALDHLAPTTVQIVEPNGSSRAAGGEQSNGDLDPFQEEEDDEFNEDEFSTAKENEARDPAPTLLPRARAVCADRLCILHSSPGHPDIPSRTAPISTGADPLCGPPSCRHCDRLCRRCCGS